MMDDDSNNEDLLFYMMLSQNKKCWNVLSVFGFFREREKVSQICIHPRSSFLRAPQIMWWQRGEQEPECEVQAWSQIFKGSQAKLSLFKVII